MLNFENRQNRYCNNHKSVQHSIYIYSLSLNLLFFIDTLVYFFLVAVITSESQILSKQHERKYMQTSIKISNSSYQLNCDRCTRKRKNEHKNTHTHTNRPAYIKTHAHIHKTIGRCWKKSSNKDNCIMTTAKQEKYRRLWKFTYPTRNINFLRFHFHFRFQFFLYIHPLLPVNLSQTPILWWK